MKYCATANMSALPSASHADHAEVESLLQSWQGELLLSKLPNHPAPISPHMIPAEALSPEASEDTKSGLDVLDHLIMSSQLPNSSLAELKPLPPFTGYTGHLSINGISGHHYHAIAQRLPEENNNFPSQSGYGSEQNIVSSSTCVSDSGALEDSKVFPINSDGESKMFSSTADNTDSKLFLNSSADSCANMHADSPGVKMYGVNPDSCELNSDSVTPKTEMYDISSIEDIAAIIGSAIADTTVPSQVEDPEQSASKDSWMDLDAWFEGTCAQQDTKIIISPDNLSEFVLPHSPQHIQHDFSNKLDYNSKHNHDVHKNQDYIQRSVNHSGSTLQSLLTHGYMPLLQNRLQNGPPVKQEVPSSTSYGMDIISTSSPPGNVVSTTDNLLLNGRYIPHHYAIGLKPEGLCSPDHMMGNYPHTTTTTPMSNKSKRSRAQKKQQQQAVSHSIAFQSAADLSGLLGKEKPVHRCNICNRGFLNKSNIKVHLRTHTGEKPFRCEVCSKAFRQKAHLIKHQQIHKRIGRD
ncbi:zinc finger protein ichor [Arctopsyche grandis]|uniref:zinc finger protein ichor n=1 Tax=Arctopsyche grandis TaxID=121162 RepID=UPI00406D9703